MSGPPREQRGHHEQYAAQYGEQHGDRYGEYGEWDPQAAETFLPEAYAPAALADGTGDYAYGTPQQHVPRQYEPDDERQPYDHATAYQTEFAHGYAGDHDGPHGTQDTHGTHNGYATYDARDSYNAHDTHTTYGTDDAYDAGDFDDVGVDVIDGFDHLDGPAGRTAFEAGHTARLAPVLPHALASDVDFAPARDAEVSADHRPAAPAATPAPVSLRDRVPIWHPPGIVPALLTACFAVVLAAGALAGGAATVGSVVLLQVLTAAGWFRLHGMWPARQGILLAVLAALAADAAVLLADDRAFRVLPGVMAGVVGLVLVQQLARRDGRPEMMPALTATLSAAMLAVLDVLFVLAARVDGPGVRDGAPVAVGAVAVAAAVLCAALPLPGPVGAVLGLAAAAGVGVVVGSMTDLDSAAVLGVGAGLLGLLGRRVAGYDHPSRFVHMTAGVALPLALAAPAVYLLGRMAIG